MSLFSIAKEELLASASGGEFDTSVLVVLTAVWASGVFGNPF
jgi:hypothetical protein